MMLFFPFSLLQEANLKKEFEIDIVVQVLIQISKKRGSVFLRKILSDVLQSRHLRRQVGEREASVLSPHRHELRKPQLIIIRCADQNQENQSIHR